MNRLLCVACAVFPLLAASCSSTSAEPDESHVNSADQHHVWLREFGSIYDYDVRYLEQLLELSPGTYEAFAASMDLADRCVHLPLDAHYVALISALLADDCGSCTQLNLRLAVAAGVDRSMLELLLEEPAALPPTLLLIHNYATQVVRGNNAASEIVAELRRSLGDEAFAELAVNVIGARIYPALRRALGAETACPPPNLDF